METKSKTLKTGRQVLLYLIVTENRWTIDKDYALLHADTFDIMSEWIQSGDNDEDFIIDEYLISRKKMSSVMEFYYRLNIRNKQKIREMLNSDVQKLEILYDMVMQSIVAAKQLKKV